jgi:hypothetical protein
MDTRPPPPPDAPARPGAADPPGGVVRWRDGGDIAAGLPALLGFRPGESLVAIGVGGDGGRVRMAARADIPPPEHAREVARSLARAVGTERPDGAVVAVVTEAPDEAVLVPEQAGDVRGRRVPDAASALTTALPYRDQVSEVRRALAGQGIELTEAVLVRGGRWWSYLCPEACCLPAAGTPVPGGTSEIEAAAVAAGTVIARDRTELAERIARPADVPAGMASAVLRAGRSLAADLADGDPADAARRRWAAVAGAVARCAPGARAALPDDAVAEVCWALRDVLVRDRALALATGEDAAAAEVLWTECTRRAPAPLSAAPATLLAATVWLRGEGAMARIALERALDSEPGYTLAVLLQQGLDACLPPRELRAMITAAVADCDGDG